MNKVLQIEIEKLVAANVISNQNANDIKLYYQNNASKSQSKLLLIFGILGAILLGLGIILILAHNWDNLSKISKTILSFIPLLIGQFFCAFSILKKQNNSTWNETSAVFLCLAIGACLSLVAQVYHISGDFSSFMLTWCLLSLPLAYLLNSSIVSLLYIAGITIYCCDTNFPNYPRLETNYWYVILLLGIIPYYYHLLKNKPTSNFTSFHNYCICISLLLFLSIFGIENHQIAINVAYLCLLAIFYFIGLQPFFIKHSLLFNSYYIIGKLGTIFLLFVFSFKTYWQTSVNQPNADASIRDLFIATLLFLSALILAIYKIKIYKIQNLQVIEVAFFIITFLMCVKFNVHYMANILILLIGITEIKRGIKVNNLGILNFGLLIITILIICRFFDSNLSFVLRGLLFIAVGTGFFVTNYVMIKNRNLNEYQKL